MIYMTSWQRAILVDWPASNEVRHTIPLYQFLQWRQTFTFTLGKAQSTMVNIGYFIAISMILALVEGAPLDGSHRSAPANPTLYYRADDASGSSPRGSHRSALANPRLYDSYGYRADESSGSSHDGSHRSAPSDWTLFAINPNLSILNGSHRSAPQATPYDGETRYTLRSSANTGVGNTNVWKQVWER